MRQARKVGGFSLLLEVEARSEAEADEAIAAGADVVMLDNMDGAALAGAARRLREKWAGRRTFLFECSGNITEENLRERAVDGACARRGRVSGRVLTDVRVGRRNRYLEHERGAPVRPAYRLQPQDPKTGELEVSQRRTKNNCVECN